METKTYEVALRNKFRFNSKRGVLTVEDLWDLSLGELDEIAVAYHKQVKSEDNSLSFIGKRTAAVKTQQLKFDIVKHIIDVKLAEKAGAEEAADKKARKQKILALIADKQDAALADKTVDELTKELEALD